MNNNYNALAKAVRFATLAAIAAPASVMAGGFSLNEQSASTSGYANAGAAAHAADASTVFFNPAGMSKLSGTNVSFGASVLDIDAEAKSGSQTATNQVGEPVTGSGGGDIADPAVLPSLFVTHEVNDSIDVGFALHAPYGLAADYDNDFQGRFFADKTELSVISFSPSLAVSNGEGLSMGAGINIMYAEGRLSRYQDISGKLLRDDPRYTTPEEATAAANAFEDAFGAPYADVEGDDVAINFKVGFLYDISNRTQVGLTYQTSTEFELEGDIKVSGAPNQMGNGVQPTLQEDAYVPLDIPESVTFGVSHQLTDDITVLAGATYAKWSRFEELDVYSAEGNQGEVADLLETQGDQPLTHVTEEWKNTWQFNVGGIWQATPKWQLKAGYAYDESPVNNYVTARIPSQDRHWLTLGTQWKDVQSGWTVDAAVGTLIFDGDAKVEDREYSHDNPSVQTSKASYDAEYDLSAWSASLQVSKAF
ncbi:long-chain fatty acid transport protein [Marinobacter persicus]|uniref:Long-chain fatty acid transport protein n=1 Tax=Marinobacter persicus TaxID=930118 RepID=A0A1I3T9Q4_9GAMM|nr:outer membrane protein transport protein [Marinobacter persicus]GHD40287.1 putative outer membrane protein [Marinobacter persicus]SFJ66227.1 long-chain fatty acid transport protein [Marinobacter persicus]